MGKVILILEGKGEKSYDGFMASPDPLSEVLTIKEASQQSKLSDGYLRYLIIRKKIKGRKAGGTWLLDLKSFQKFLKSDRKPGPRAQ